MRDGHADALDLRAQFVEQLLLHGRAHLQRTLRQEVHRIREDRFAAREVRDRRERSRALDHFERQALQLRFDRGRHAGDAAAQDHDVHEIGVRRLATALRVRRDRAHRAHARVERELEERHARQVAAHEHTGHVRAAAGSGDAGARAALGDRGLPPAHRLTCMGRPAFAA